VSDKSSDMGWDTMNQQLIEITHNAKESGMALADYIKANYDREGLDELKVLVTMEMANRRPAVKKVRRQRRVRKVSAVPAIAHANLSIQAEGELLCA